MPRWPSRGTLPIPNPTQSGTLLIPLTKGHFAVIDEADGPAVSPFTWYALVEANRQTPYAQANTGRADGRPRREKLHRFLWRHWGLPDVPGLDHRNTDGLDCRRENLRPATDSQNQANTKVTKKNTSGFKGVIWHSSRGRWEARIEVQGRIKQLGSFARKEEAAAAYERGAREIFGNFARAG